MERMNTGAEHLLDAVRRARERADARVDTASHADGLVAEAASWALSLIEAELEDELEKFNRRATPTCWECGRPLADPTPGECPCCSATDRGGNA